MKPLEDQIQITYKIMSGVVIFHAALIALLLLATGCASTEKRMLTLPAVDEHNRSLAYVSDSNYGPRGCGAAITPTGGKVWIYTLDCFWNCNQAQENLGIVSPTLCQQICK